MIYISNTIFIGDRDQFDVFNGFKASFLSLLIGCVMVTLGLVVMLAVY